MLDGRWRKMWREAWLHKTRTCLVIVAMTLGLIGAGALLNSWALLRAVTQRTYLGSLPPAATLVLDQLDAALLEEIRALPDIAVARARRTVGASVQMGGAWRRVELFALDDFERPDIGLLRGEVGEWPPRDGSLVIERSALEFSGATVGEDLTLRVGKAMHALPVRGIVRDVGLAPGWMDHVVYAFATPATLANLGVSTDLNEVQFRLRDTGADRAAVRRVAGAVKALAERQGRRVLNIDVPEPGQHMHAAQMDSMLLVQAAFAVLTLVVCGLLVFNLIAAMLASQVREIGVMKAMGGRSGQIAAMYVGFAAALGLLAALLALPLALAGGRWYAAFRAEMLNFPLNGASVPVGIVALQLATGLLLPLLAAALPVARGCRLSVAAALRDLGLADGAPRARRSLPIGGLGRPLLLSLGNALRRRSRLIMTMLALAIGGAVYLGAANLRVAMLGSVDELYAAHRFAISLRFADSVPVEAAQAVARAVAEVDDVEGWTTADARHVFADGTQGSDFAVYGVPPASALFVPKLSSGRWLQDGDTRALVIAARLLRDDAELRPGAQVPLLLDGEVAMWNVVGVAETGPESAVYVPRRALSELRGEDRATSLVVATSARGVVAQLDLIQRLRNSLDAAGMPVGGSLRMDESRRVAEDHLLMVLQFLGSMGWVMILVGGMGLASTLSLAVLERRREIGVLRAIGAGHGDIVLLVVLEGVIIAACAWLIALPLSVPISASLAAAFGRIMFPVPAIYLPEPRGVCIWLFVVVVVAILASLWPALRATRVPAAVALSYE